MYRRLVLFGLSVVAVAVIALVVPLGLAARDVVRAEELSSAADYARSIANEWQRALGDEGPATPPPSFRPPKGEGDVSLIPPVGPAIGAPVPPDAEPVVAAARRGASASVDTGGVGYAAAPVLLDDRTGAVLVVLSAEDMNEGLTPRLVALAGVSAALLGFAAFAAWLLARRTVKPITELAATADAIADGDLDARVGESGIPEVNDVGRALNRLAERVQELLADERANAAELAHQLRTPLTVLTADIDAVADDDVRSRLLDDAVALQRQTDEIITTARRSSREGLRARCDAAAVVADRVGFWQVLADDQGRSVAVDLPGTPLWVRLTAEDLTTLVDILLQNVFIHTPDGTGYEVSATAWGPDGKGTGGGRILVRDRGPGFAPSSAGAAVTGERDARPTDRPGTTGLGLSIARRLAEASGGRLNLSDADGGAAVEVLLGPPRS